MFLHRPFRARQCPLPDLVVIEHRDRWRRSGARGGLIPIETLAPRRGMRLARCYGIEALQGRYALTTAADVLQEKKLVLLCGTAGKRGGDLAMGLSKETDLLSVFIRSGRSTRSAQWQTRCFLRVIEVDGIWMETL